MGQADTNSTDTSRLTLEALILAWLIPIGASTPPRMTLLPSCYCEVDRPYQLMCAHLYNILWSGTSYLPSLDFRTLHHPLYTPTSQWGFSILLYGGRGFGG